MVFEQSSLGRDRCPGSGAYVSLEPPRPVPEPLSGVCPVCGRQLALGYAGIVPLHARETPDL